MTPNEQIQLLNSAAHADGEVTLTSDQWRYIHERRRLAEEVCIAAERFWKDGAVSEYGDAEELRLIDAIKQWRAVKEQP